MRAVRVPAECTHSQWMQGGAGKDFEYFLCTDYPGHFGKGRVRFSDWFYENFPKDARRFVKADYAAIRQYGKLLRQMTPTQIEAFAVPASVLPLLELRPEQALSGAV